MKVPEEVIKAAGQLVEQYGENFEYLGRKDDTDYFLYAFPEDSCTGFPFVYAFKDGDVDTMTGDIAFYIIDLFIEDVDEVDAE